MGSLQFTEQDLRQFEEGPRWYRLQHVKTGEILLVMKRVGGVDEELEWSHLDEASRPLHLVGESKFPRIKHRCTSCIILLSINYNFSISCSSSGGQHQR